jgi:hypothetical protein
MFIKHITSYGDAWQILNKDYPEVISDIKSAISTLLPAITKEGAPKSGDPFDHNPRIALEVNFSERMKEKRLDSIISKRH